MITIIGGGTLWYINIQRRRLQTYYNQIKSSNNNNNNIK